MILNKYFLFLLCSFFLTGCASFNISDLVNSQKLTLISGDTDIPLSLSSSNSTDYREKSCRKAWLSKDTKITYETVQEKSSEEHTFFINRPIRHFEGIKSATINDGRLQIYFWGKGEVEEYSSPIYRSVSLEKFEARPAGTLVWSTLGLGLPLLLAPSGTINRAFGCTDETVNKKYANASFKQKTGKTQWTNFHKSQRLIITGIGNPIEINAVADSINGISVIDLTDQIQKTSFLDTSKVMISCVTCVIEIDKDQSISTFAGKSYTFSHDFRVFKKYLLDRDDALAKNQVKDSVPKVNKNSDTVSSKSDTSRIETTTQRCKKLGLMENSSDFSLCVKSLSK